MRKLIAALALGSALTISAGNVFAYSLPQNNQPAQPKENTHFVHDEENTALLVLPNYSQASMHNLLENLKKEVGRDHHKTVTIFWTDRSSKESAVKIQRVLLANHLKQKNITLKKSVDNAVYPLYVEVKHMQPRPTNCHSGVIGSSIERKLGCAINHNQRIQLDR